MFSAAINEGGPAKGTRSSRRRARPSSTDASVQQPKAKRQRVPLSETTFVNPEAPPEMFEVKSDKIDLNIRRDGIEAVSAPRKELSVRSKKPKPGERASKGDGSVVLTQNNAYTVSKLPALPDRLRADPQNRQHGAVYSWTGYAMSITHTHAYVWPYTSTSASPETFAFTLPYPSKNASDPLPLGSLVSPTASAEEPGLVVVMPLSGKIVYWESISSAATLDFIRQQRGGVEDVVSGMFSGEHIVQIVNAESVGFVLVFSSGRLAYMNVRDIHGRPGVSVQFLRSGLSNNASGFFGSLRHALSSSTLRGDIAAARASQGIKLGERVVVAATTKGRLSCWKVHRGGRHELLADDDVREKVVRTIHQTCPSSGGSPQDAFEVVDFTFVPRGLETKYVEMSRLSQALSHEQEDLQHLLMLVAFAGRRHSQYVLVELVVSAKEVEVGMVRPLVYATPARQSAASKPRIYLPRPGLVAYVVFDRAVVVASMASPPDSPDSQLQEDSHIIPPTFEDVIDFQDQGTTQVVGSGIEEPNGHGPEDLRGHRHRTKNPTVVLLVQGVGTIRVAVTDVDRFGSERPPEVTPKSKLEQAVFFGTKNDNPLVFQGRRSLPFSAKQIGDAAVELSNEIVSSKSPFMVNLPASLENNMRTRGQYLEKLITYLNATGVELDLRTRWILLYNAEKMAVATWIWQKHEQFLAERPDDDKKTVVSETVVFINEQQKTEPNPAIGQVDPVRFWFLNDIWRLNIFIAWAYQIIKYAWTERTTDEQGIARLLWEAVTINNGALSVAYEYRQAHSQLYGVDPKRISSSDAAKEPWTSNHYITNNIKRLVELCYTWLNMHYLRDVEDSAVSPEVVEAVRAMLPSLTNRYFSALKEGSEWALRSENAEMQELGRTYLRYYEQDKYEKILELKNYGLWDEAIILAKEHSAFEALAEIVVQQILTLQEEAETSLPGPDEDRLAVVDAKKRQMGRLFDQYETEFAYPAYEVLLKNGGVQAVLEFPYDKNGYATSFLRTKPELAKISWINDVEREKDIDHAAETLLNLGLSREQQVWNKKIELSLGKLALLAEEVDASVNGDSVANGYPESETRYGVHLETIDRELALIKIQDSLYGQVLPTIQEAVDEAAELELALKEYGGLIPAKQKAVLHIFEDALSRLLKHEALRPLTLIDLLTLAQLPPTHFENMGDQFFLALKVAKFGLRDQDRENAERLIWRRCLLRDDWKRVNETNNKNDLDQLEIIGGTAAYRTMFAIVDEQQSDKSFRPFVKPSEALGVYTDNLDSRFNDMDAGFKHKLLEVMKAEDKKLKAFIEKSQLDAWYRTTLDCAEKIVAAAYNQLTETKASERAVEPTPAKLGNGTVKKTLFQPNRENGSRPNMFSI